ncbi:hypothetical protein BLA60_16135 [Actinophytocola xinjiangensis]|uniref:Uncharacterized protein n=1 Tax=Actinophytocola xinjiangensis TaxID=485602 RepID=A0A7Z0WM70_9PSEU|nr:hypothetical protein [Actinophytocola xinjiangensis]OLF10691.1 hypothetical protein BLA60_16135 [Actinophytocola xinjiangensis]
MRWIRWCAYGAFAAAVPTALWRIVLAAGPTLGTPARWRAAQDIPGTGTWYVLTLSVLQLLAAACAFALVVDVRRLTPRWTPEWLRRRAGTLVGVAGIAGSGLLLLIVGMSVIAWDKVDPFAGQPYDGWAWLCLGSYLCAALWPVLLMPASIGYLAHRRRAGTPVPS